MAALAALLLLVEQNMNPEIEIETSAAARALPATLKLLDPSKLDERLDVLRPYIFREI